MRYSRYREAVTDVLADVLREYAVTGVVTALCGKFLFLRAKYRTLLGFIQNRISLIINNRRYAWKHPDSMCGFSTNSDDVATYRILEELLEMSEEEFNKEYLLYLRKHDPYLYNQLVMSMEAVW